MPTNKNAQLRFLVLDRCFSDFSRKYEIDDLLNLVNAALSDLYGTSVSIRQIREDIKCMRDRMTYGAPIESVPYDGKRCYYRYADRNFSIFKNELSVKEVSNLRSTIEMLGKYRGVAGNAWLEEVISNLEYRFGLKTNKENVVAFEQNDQLKGLKFLSALIDSAVNHQPLRVLYRSFRGKEKTCTVHPYHLKQYNTRWFLFGLEENEKHGNFITNMALDRIVSFSYASDVAFIPNDSINFLTHFRDIVGVTIPEDHPVPEEVILRFDKARFPYIVSKPIHRTQRVINEDACVLSIMVRPNKELEAQILSYGCQVEVIKPLWLRERIARNIAESYNRYAIGKTDCTNNA